MRTISHRDGSHKGSECIFLLLFMGSLFLQLFLNKHIHYDPLLEPCHQDGADEGSQLMFQWRKLENYS